MTKWKQQLQAFLYKKFQVSRRDKKFLCTGLLTPISSSLMVVLIYTVLSSFIQTNAFRLFPATEIDFSDLFFDPARVTYVVEMPEQKEFIGSHQQNAKSGLLGFIDNQYNDPSLPSFEEFPSLVEMNNFLLYNVTSPSYIGGIRFINVSATKFEVGLLYNNTDNSNLNLMMGKSFSEAVYRYLANNSALSITEIRQDWPQLSLLTDISFVYYGPVILTYGFVFIIPFFAISVIQEKEKGLKDMLLLNSLDRRMYWLGTFVADFAIYAFPMVIALFLIYIFQVLPITANNLLGPLSLFFGLALYTLAAAYLISFLFDKEETANKFVYPITSFLTIVTSLISGVIGGPSDGAANYITAIGWGPYAFFKGLFNMSYRQVQDGGLSFAETFDFTNGVAPYVLILYFDALIVFIVAIQIDLRLQRLSGDPCSCSSENLLDQVSDPRDIEEDVEQEQKRILQGANDLIQISGIKKVYKEENNELNYAVRGVTLGIPAGECFGLLGPNGAGKTSLISILSGLLKPEAGTASIQGHDILKDINSAYSYLGVCQQNDILYDLLTPFEHLYLYGLIKGLEDPKAEAKRFIEVFSLGAAADLFSSELSGGNRRKLSVALALLGNPKVVFLDEPATGLDPKARRTLWKLIDIILTTHSMEEADALCDKIGIMVKGQLQCLGSSQHLKSKFGKGYRLSLTCDSEISAQDLLSWLRKFSPNAALEEDLGETFHFEIPQTDTSLSVIFGQVENHKESLKIVDYSVSQTTLEQIFLKFAYRDSESSNSENSQV